MCMGGYEGDGQLRKKVVMTLKKTNRLKNDCSGKEECICTLHGS